MKIIEVNQYHPSVSQMQIVISALEKGQIVILPTDTFYCACCIPKNNDALTMITKLQAAISKERPLTFLCKDISQASELMSVENMHYRIMNSVVPAAVTFLLPAKPTTLKRLKMSRRTEIGIRIPKHNLIHTILEQLELPLLVQSLESIHDDDYIDQIAPFISYWLKVYYGCSNQVSSIIDLTNLPPKLIRSGQDIEKIKPFIDLHN